MTMVKIRTMTSVAWTTVKCFPDATDDNSWSNSEILCDLNATSQNV